MSWNIEIADAAYEDLRNIYAYIAFELRTPDDARDVLRRILAEIATLVASDRTQESRWHRMVSG